MVLMEALSSAGRESVQSGFVLDLVLNKLGSDSA